MSDERRLAQGVAVDIGGERYDLYFGYAGHKRVIKDRGKTFDKVIDEDLLDGQEDPDAMALLLSVGIGGVLTPEQVFDISPPMVPSLKALDKARNVFYYGSEEVPDVDPIKTTVRKAWKALMVEVGRAILRR